MLDPQKKCENQHGALSRLDCCIFVSMTPRHWRCHLMFLQINSINNLTRLVTSNSMETHKWSTTTIFWSCNGSSTTRSCDGSSTSAWSACESAKDQPNAVGQGLDRHLWPLICRFINQNIIYRRIFHLHLSCSRMSQSSGQPYRSSWSPPNPWTLPSTHHTFSWIPQIVVRSLPSYIRFIDALSYNLLISCWKNFPC